MREYGGYLPLELPEKEEYYSEKQYPLLKVNSGRAALYAILKMINPKQVYVPHYVCDTVYEVFSGLGVIIKKYFITEDMQPLVEKVQEDEYILLVNYFGMFDKRMQELAEQYERVIIDNTQAFFCSPIIRKNVYNIYSCRKFIGVPDGGYLIAEDLKYKHIELEQGFSGEYAGFLMTSLEKGTHFAYQENLKNEERLSGSYKKMSKLTESLLGAVKYSRISNARMKNWNILKEQFQKINILSNLVETSIQGYMYPLMVKADIREKLIAEHIYVPCLWKEKLQQEYAGTNEYLFSKYILPLPIDQRYNVEDMRFLSDKIYGFL